MTTEPTTTLDQRYGESDAIPMAWQDAEGALTSAELSWVPPCDRTAARTSRRC